MPNLIETHSVSSRTYSIMTSVNSSVQERPSDTIIFISIERSENLTSNMAGKERKRRKKMCRQKRLEDRVKLLMNVSHFSL
jgi:hypothetical protein